MSAFTTSGFRLDFPRADVSAFMQRVKRLEKDLNFSSRGALRYAGRIMLAALAASTKTSPQFRRYVKKGKSRSGRNFKFEVTTKYQTPKRKGKALRRSWQGPWRNQTVYAPSVAALKKRPALIIAMKGVAKASWAEAGARGKFRPRVSQRDYTKNASHRRIMKKAARRWVSSDAKFNDREKYISVSNRIRHIASALAGGKKTAGSALKRAADRLDILIEKKLETLASRVA